MSTSYSSKYVNVLIYVAKIILFAQMIKLRILRWKYYFILSQWGQCNQRSVCKKDGGMSEPERKRFEDIILLVLKMGRAVMSKGMEADSETGNK